MQDHYEILGLDPSATADEIRRAFRRLALIYHPDVNRSPDAVGTFQNINSAYQVLIDPVKRAEYDAQRSATGSPSSASFSDGQLDVRRFYFERRVRAAGNPRSTWNYYDVLGLPTNATRDTIVRASERLYRNFYGTGSVDPATGAILREIIDARDVLTDPERRRSYDSLPAHQQAPGRPRRQSAGRASGRGRRASVGNRAETRRGCLVGLLTLPMAVVQLLIRRISVL